MGWKLEKKRRRWEWMVYNSAYGSASGTAKTKAEAQVEMVITEAEIFETPYPPRLVERWRSDYEAALVEIGPESLASNG